MRFGSDLVPGLLLQVEAPGVRTQVMAHQLVLEQGRLVGAVAEEDGFQLGDVIEAVINVARTGRRLPVVFRQGQRAVTAFRRGALGPVVDLEWDEVGAGRIEAEQAVAVDRDAAVLLVVPAIVEQDALDIGVVNELVPAGVDPLAVFVGTIRLHKFRLDRHPGVRRNGGEVLRSDDTGSDDQKRQREKTSHGMPSIE